MLYVDEVLQSAPRGSNPYEYAAETLKLKLIPNERYLNAMLFVFGSFAAVNFISTVAAFIVFRQRSQSGSGISFWFFRARYGHPSGVPYIMPNALTMYLLWNAVFMLFLQVTMWLRYIATQTPALSGKSSTFFWYSFAYIWNGVGIWLSTFGTLYTIILPQLSILASSERRLMSTILHPISLNTFCFIPPFVLIVTQVTTSIYAAVTWSKLIRTNSSLVNVFNIAATQWTEGSDQQVNEALRQKATTLGALLQQDEELARSAYRRSAGTCAFWYWICLIAFVPTAIWLMFVISETVKHQARPSRLSIASLKPGAISQPISYSESNIITRDEAVRHLKWACSTVGLQFLVTFLYTAAAAGAWLWTLVHTKRLIESGKLRSYLVLWYMGVLPIAGCLVNLFIIIRIARRKEDQQGSSRIATEPPIRLRILGFPLTSVPSLDSNKETGLTAMENYLATLHTATRDASLSPKTRSYPGV